MNEYLFSYPEVVVCSMEIVKRLLLMRDEKKNAGIEREREAERRIYK